jgi:hypothetical protein
MNEPERNRLIDALTELRQWANQTKSDIQDDFDQWRFEIVKETGK